MIFNIIYIYDTEGYCIQQWYIRSQINNTDNIYSDQAHASATHSSFVTLDVHGGGETLLDLLSLAFWQLLVATFLSSPEPLS